MGVERWVGSVLLLLRSLITHSTPELVLARLEELGLSMDYVHSDVTSDTSPGPTPSGSEALSPQVGDHASGFRDPLNVTQPETLPQVAMARYDKTGEGFRSEYFLLVLFIFLFLIMLISL